MKNYLSFGGGVNSTAMYLMLLDQGVEFEAVYVDHGCDWPETREYVKDFSSRYPVTILTPSVEGEKSLYDYCKKFELIPGRMRRWCTDKFKSRILEAYQVAPCFVFIGYAADEIHRAKISSHKGFEYRWPLIEEGVNREGCKEIIRSHDEAVPMKSGCYFCPFQRKAHWLQLRRKHPKLFCNAENLEKIVNKKRATEGKSAIYLSGDKALCKKINDKQTSLPGMEDIEYPPCECGL